MKTEAKGQARVSTGIPGLDEVLCGGLLAGRIYLVRGGPGVGKTAVGLHFLAEGARRREPVAFLSHGSSEEQIAVDAASLGIDTSGISFVDFSPPPEYFQQSQGYDVFPPVDVERDEFATLLLRRFDEIKPRRVFLDSLTQVRHLSEDLIDFRRQAHAFLRFLSSTGATVIFASGSSDRSSDEDLQFMSDGVLSLDYSVAFGRSLVVTKLRGSGFRLGEHSARIDDDGLHVYPRLLPETFGRTIPDERIGSGVPELDAILNGGIERGQVTLITGPTGVGKTTVATQFVKAACERGEHAVIYTFEETLDVLRRRSDGVGMHLGELIDSGRLSVVEVEPLHYTPDQFAMEIREEIEERSASVVMIDSTAGYRLSMQGKDLVPHLHALCKYLKKMGATVLLLYESPQITGDFRITDSDVSYLADNILFLRYVEMAGELRRVVGVLKKRTSDFQTLLRELEISADGVTVGAPLAGFRGILSGIPQPAAPLGNDHR
jgi:circadian clock protein KaiC